MRRYIKIYFFGDSICFGQYVSVHKTWLVRISKKICEFGEKNGAEVLVQNPSVNGDITRRALDRMPFDILSHEPDILYIQFGMNDCNYWETDKGAPRVSPEAFRDNLTEIVNRAKNYGVRQIIQGTNHPSLKNKYDWANISYQENNEYYNRIIREVAELTSVELIDNEREWKNKIKKGLKLEELLMPDKVHLSSSGHDVYCDVVYPYVEKAVERLLS